MTTYHKIGAKTQQKHVETMTCNQQKLSYIVMSSQQILATNKKVYYTLYIRIVLY